MAKEIHENTSQIISKVPDILDFYKEFAKNCTREYMRAMMTSHISTAMIDKFSWGNQKIKEKATMAALLCDIVLEEEDFKELEEKKGVKSELSQKILQHPSTVAEMLKAKADKFSSETISIIQQHHERPNGNGYPEGITYQITTILSCVYIVAYYFVEQMFPMDEDNDQEIDEARRNIILKSIPEKFYSGNYRKATDALHMVFNFKPDDDQGTPVNPKTKLS